MRQFAGTKTKYPSAHAAPLVRRISGRVEERTVNLTELYLLRCWRNNRLFFDALFI